MAVWLRGLAVSKSVFASPRDCSRRTSRLPQPHPPVWPVSVKADPRTGALGGPEGSLALPRPAPRLLLFHTIKSSPETLSREGVVVGIV